MAATKRLIIAGAITLAAGLIISFPARVAYQWFVPPEVRLSGISGTLWNGRAAEGTAGALFLADIRWRFRPLALVTGKAAITVAASPAGGYLEGEIAVAVNGTLHLSNVAASMPLRTFENVIAMNGISGEVGLRLARLVVENGLPVDASGTVTVSNLIIRPLDASVLGDYRATFDTVDGVLRGNVEDLTGVLDVTGTVELSPDRSYSLTGLIAAANNAPATVREQLRFLGPADAEGRRQFGLDGRL